MQTLLFVSISFYKYVLLLGFEGDTIHEKEDKKTWRWMNSIVTVEAFKDYIINKLYLSLSLVSLMNTLMFCLDIMSS